MIIRYVVASLTKLLKFEAGATLSELPTFNMINFQVLVKRKDFVSSSYSSAAKFRTTITDRLMGDQASENSEAILPFRVHIAANK